MKDKMERRSFFLMLAIISGLFFYMLKPFFAPLFWACVIGLLFYPLQGRFERLWGSRPSLNALVTLLVCVVVVVIPVILVLASVVAQAADLYQRIATGEINPAALVEKVRQALPQLEAFLARFGLEMETLKQHAASGAVTASRFVAQNALAMGQNTFQFFLYLGLMLYVAFFLLRDGQRLVSAVARALPLGEERERELFDKFSEVTRATVKGNLVVAIVQGALGGLIFWILGLPAAVLWAVAMAVLSLIPAVGAGLVWVPAALYLYASGQWISATVLIAYGVLVIGLADNILRPILVGRDTKLPDWLVLLSTLGGLAMVGINGFIVGPLVAALFVVSWQIFGRDFNFD